MLRDERGGKAVNLTDSELPEDIYEIVRKVVKEKISRDNSSLSVIWNSDKNLDRALVKRPVMTTPYGATLYGMREQLHEEMKKQKRNVT